MARALAWIGGRADWLLAAGLALCFVVPQVSSFLRPALPWLVPVVLGIAMARVDLPAVARAALAPRAAGGLLLTSVLLMPASAAVYLGVGRLLGADDDLAAALVLLAAAPPIASSANLCFLMGYDAPRALAVTVAACALTPLLGPLTVALLLPGAAPIGPADLALKLGLMIGGGVLVAVALRRGLTPARIAAHSRSFDGVAVIGLVVFVLPLFDGVPALLAAEPGRAAVVLAAALVANFGVNFGLRAALGRVMPKPAAGAYGVLFGNRTIAIYFAALPYDPHFAAFVALYQIPILLTPLAHRTILSLLRN